MVRHPVAVNVNTTKRPRFFRANVPRMTSPLGFGELAEQFACPTLSSILGRGRGFQRDLCRVSPQMWINAATVGRWTGGRTGGAPSPTRITRVVAYGALPRDSR